MIYFFYGTDRSKARAAVSAAAANVKGARIVRITDASAPEDLRASLQGGGMFAQMRAVVYENVLENEEMRQTLLDALPALKSSDESFFILEEKPEAATRKLIEKYAETSEKFDAAKKTDGGSAIFALANALRRGDKKNLWISYQRQLLNGDAPEAIHGVLFWGAKDFFLKANSESEKARAKKLVSQLAMLPHEARRQGEDLEYALERFVLLIA